MSPFHAIGLRVREYIWALVGLRGLSDQLAQLSAGVASVLALVNQTQAGIAARFDQIATRRDVTEAGIGARFDAIAARLDAIEGGIAARFDVIEARTAECANAVALVSTQLTAGHGPLAELIASELDRLDGYLVHHAAILSERIAASHSETVGQLLALTRRPQHAYIRQGLDAVVLADDFELIIPTQEAGLLGYILRHGLELIDPGVRAVLGSRLQRGAVAVDAGANIGIHALTMAAAVGRDGHVLCFEPLPQIALTLARTLRLNGFGRRTEVKQLALADTSGETTFYRAAHGPMSSLYALPDELEVEPITVRTVKLDESFVPGARVDLVKMDVEGAEPRVWRGMQRVLTENPGIDIVLEWSASHFRRTGEDPEEFMSEIRAAGFNAYVIKDGPAVGQLIPLGENATVLEAGNLLLTRCLLDCPQSN